jgi:hypothetical protein
MTGCYNMYSELPHSFHYWAFPYPKSHTLISYLILLPLNCTVLYYMSAAHLYLQLPLYFTHNTQHYMPNMLDVHLPLWSPNLHHTEHMLSQTEQCVTFSPACHIPIRQYGNYGNPGNRIVMPLFPPHGHDDYVLKFLNDTGNVHII